MPIARTENHCNFRQCFIPQKERNNRENRIKITQYYFRVLTEYSPDYNLIELVWHSTKEYVAHRLFKSVQELETTLDKLLNQGELLIKWKRKIKNKGNAVIAN